MDKKFTLYLDDTGFNAFEKKSDVLQKELATYAGVLIPNDLIPILEGHMNTLCGLLKQRFGTEEFHFTEIYNRKKEFANIEINETLDILSTFAEIFYIYDLKIFVSTINSEEKRINEQSFLNAVKFLSNVLDLPDNEKTTALMTTFIKARVHVNLNHPDSKVDTFICDEGLRNVGFEEGPKNKDFVIKFDSSKDNKLLQLADYAAWFVTRAKNIFDKMSSKKKISDVDKQVLLIYESLTDNYVNFTQASIDLEDISNFSYDESIRNTKK